MGCGRISDEWRLSASKGRVTGAVDGSKIVGTRG
jgi:hypothetical protein